MYDAIIANVKSQQKKPDCVFFTGDLSFSGADSEYKLLRDRFLDPLKAALTAGCPIFTVPGNHDVDRKRAGNPRTWMTDSKQQLLFQQVGEDGRRKRVDMILPRFENYRALEKSLGAWGIDWLSSEKGTASIIRDINGHRVAVVGINTAWLCDNGEDWGRLSAGRTMIDAALNEARAMSPELTIVLGHHPLAAMAGETEWSDGDRIKIRLEQANAVYLHGHLHRSGVQRSGETMQSVLGIQAPSGFQAGDSQIWRNGILWSEVDFEAGQLIVEPLRWNDDNREYVFDSDAASSKFRVDGRDAFVYPLPGRIGATPIKPIEGAPEGWQIISPARLAEMTNKRPSTATMADWFNGSFPRWEIVAAKGVRARKVVDDLVRLFEAAHHSAPRPTVRLLTGAGGEGKSAALLQTAAGLMRGGQAWSCLWRQSSAAELPPNLANLLPRKDKHAWIVAIDDAENVGGQLAETLRNLGARTDVHVILAAREADWVLRGPVDGIWQSIANYGRAPIAGLDEEDARRIADSWAAWGDGAMGKLRGETPERAARALLDNARALAAKREEGALLGALLIVREGEELRERVIRLMAPWKDAPGVGKRSLLDIYAMIAAMHAENQLYLSRSVLAYALGCEESDLDRGPLRVLRREAMVDGGTAYVLTRHRRIAEVACDWLVENGSNIDQWYPFLVRAVITEFKKRRSGNPDINKWQWGLARHFLEQGPSRWGLARQTANALFSSDINDPLLLTHYTGILRRTGRSDEALALMLEHAKRFKGRRDVTFEWSVTAGLAGDLGLAAWLAARSMADDQAKPLESNDCKRSLAGLGAAFRELAKRTRRNEFRAAQAICGRLGLSLDDLDPTTRGHFEEHSAAEPRVGRGPATIEEETKTLKLAVVKASHEALSENSAGLDAFIGEPDAYNYKMLVTLLRKQTPTHQNSL